MATKTKGSRSVPLRQIKAECDLILQYVVKGQVVSPEEVASYTPGGAKNPATDVMGWWKFNRMLHRWDERRVHQETGTLSDANEITLLNALRGEPETLVCLTKDSDDPDARPMTLQVYPKSFHALMEIAGLDQMIAWLAGHYQVQRELMTGADQDVALRILPEIIVLYQRLAWIVTTPGCGLPYPEEESRPTIPALYQRLDTSDIMRLNATHHKVNQLPLLYLRKLIAEETGPAADERPSWTIFIGSAAEALKVSPHRVMRDWSLVELLMMVRTSAHVKRAAMPEAT